MALTPGLLERDEAAEMLRIFGVDLPEYELDTAKELPKIGDQLPVYGRRARGLLLVTHIPSTSGGLYTVDLARDDRRYYDPRCGLTFSHTITFCGYYCGTYTEREWFAQDSE